LIYLSGSVQLAPTKPLHWGLTRQEKYLMKKVTRLGALVAATGLIASSVLGTTAKAADVVELKMVAADYANMQPFWDDLSARFTKANPTIKVKVDVVSWETIDDKVKTLVATGQIPDIVNKGDYSAAAAEGLLYRADEVISAKVLADIVPTFLNNSKYNGVAYAVPDLASARALFYNKDILKKAGVTKLPTTWTELEKVLKQIKAKVPGVYPYALPLGPEEAQAEFAIWAGGNGGVMFKNGKWTLNSKENVQTMEFLKKLTDQKLTQPNPAKCDRTACAQALFAAGKAAFINGSVFLEGWLKDNGGAAINIGSGSFVAAPGKKPVTLGVQDYFTAYKANGRKAEISKFMDFIFEPTNYAAFLKAAGGFIPATKSAGAIAAKDAKLAPFIKLLPSAIFYPGDQASWPAVKGAIQQQVGTALVNPKKTMDALQAKALAASK
jgi:multiple sugar transport system substrate-binding protein